MSFPENNRDEFQKGVIFYRSLQTENKNNMDVQFLTVSQSYKWSHITFWLFVDLKPDLSLFFS